MTIIGATAKPIVAHAYTQSAVDRRNLSTQFPKLSVQWSLLMAASVIFTVPMIVLFFMFQRYFMEGITHTGIKG